MRATSVPSRNSCRRKHDLFMRVKRGRIGTNRANTKKFKKANKKVIHFASHFACAYPDYCSQWICRHEFSGVFIGKAYKEIWQSLHGERINFKKICVLLILFYTPEQGTETHHMTTQSFYFGNLNILDFVWTSGSYKQQTSVYRFFLNCGKNPQIKGGGESFADLLEVCWPKGKITCWLEDKVYEVYWEL